MSASPQPQEQLHALATLIRDEIMRLTRPPVLPGGPRSGGATELDLARAILTSDWLATVKAEARAEVAAQDAVGPPSERTFAGYQKQRAFMSVLEQLTAWTGINWDQGYEPGADVPVDPGLFKQPHQDERQQVAFLPAATAVSSSMEGAPHLHMITLDLDVCAYLVPSSTPGHTHLYIDKPVMWEQYEKLLQLLGEMGILGRGYVKASRARKATFLRLPWIRKRHEQEDQVETIHEWLTPNPAPLEERVAAAERLLTQLPL